MTPPAGSDFDGTKLLLFLGADLLIIRRDDRSDIPWPGFLDLPGGGREDGESAELCILRETHEETGLALVSADLVWCRFYPDGPVRVWFFAAHLPGARRGDVVFGDEGQGWLLMPPEEFAAHEEAVPHFRPRVRDYLAELGR